MRGVVSVPHNAQRYPESRAHNAQPTERTGGRTNLCTSHTTAVVAVKLKGFAAARAAVCSRVRSVVEGRESLCYKRIALLRWHDYQLYSTVLAQPRVHGPHADVARAALQGLACPRTAL